MKETTLLKLSVIVSIIGIFSLLIIAETTSLEITKISEINKKDLETKVKIQGKILSIRETPGLYILTITDNTATIPIIVFKEDELELEKNKQFVVIGKLTEYKNELEIIAERIIEND